MTSEKFYSFVKSLHFKMVLSYLSIVVVILVFLNYYPMVVAREFITTAKKDEMLSNANAIAEITHGELDSYDKYDIGFLDFISHDKYDRILITDLDAVVVYDNALSENNLTGKTVLLSEVYQAMEGQEVFLSKFTKDRVELTAAVPIELEGTVVGTVYLYKSATQEAVMLRSVQKYILIFSVMLSGMVILLSFFFSKVLTEQIKYLKGGISAMQEGTFDVHIPVKTDDELGKLADAFNELGSKMRITEQRRKEFISDASHELKTPLASIKLLVDSISQTDDVGLIKEFMGDISEEIDRLVRITERMFQLTRMDGDLKLNNERINTAGVVQGAIKVILPIARERGITIESQVEEGLFVFGPPDGFSQIVYNLLDNAVKYNRDNGIVRITLVCEEDQVVLTVMDNGMGIVKEDIENIFERFYRVDSSRSRQTGGTGLGLSIVKSNVELMGGKIEVDSRIGEGTAFVVTLPMLKD